MNMDYKVLFYYLMGELRLVLRMIGEDHPAFYIVTNTLKNCKDMEKELLKYSVDLSE